MGVAPASETPNANRHISFFICDQRDTSLAVRITSTYRTNADWRGVPKVKPKLVAYFELAARNRAASSSASSELASCNTIPVEKGTATRQQLTRKQGLNVAADVIQS